MTKQFYESPVMEELKMQVANCILEGSLVDSEDYNPVDWTW